MVENLGFTNGNQREDAIPFSRLLAAAPCSNCASPLHQHLQFVDPLPHQPQKGEKTMDED